MEQESRPVESGEPAPSLRVLRGKNVGQRFPIVNERMVIGRRRGDVVLSDPEVSGSHAEVLRLATGYVVKDLGSTNGTFLNGHPVKEALLQHGDELGVGRTTLVWEDPAAAAHLIPVEMPQGEGAVRRRIPVGIYDAIPELTGLSALVEDSMTGLEDDEGTRLMDLQSMGVELKLPAQSVVQLEIVGGPEKGRVMTLSSGNVVVGRYGTDIVLKDPDISRRHLTIEAYGRDQIFVRDLGSTNGTYVNGAKVGFSKLQSGDTVVIGRSVMQLVVKDLN